MTTPDAAARIEPSAEGLLDAPEDRAHQHSPHPVGAFILRRIAAGVLTLLVVTMLIFAVVQVLPGDTTEVVLGRNATPERIEALRGSLNLDESVVSRYFTFIGNLVTGDLGVSSAALAQGTELPVSDQIGTPFRNSLVLAAITMALFIPLSLILGTLSALRAGTTTDRVVSLSALTVAAMPEFLIGSLLILVLFTELGLLPPISKFGLGESPFTNPDLLVMPVLTLLGVCTAFGTRLVRASMVEVLREDFVTMARLNGFRERRVIVRYALRNALAPYAQVLAQTTQYLIGGIIIVESVFAYPGIGDTLVQAIDVRDTQVICVVAAILAAMYIAINILADLLVVLLVPRLRTRA